MKINIQDIEPIFVGENEEGIIPQMIRQQNQILAYLKERDGEKCGVVIGKSYMGGINRCLNPKGKLPLYDKIKKPDTPKCFTENGVNVCYCGKCKPEDYPPPSDFYTLKATQEKEEQIEKIKNYMTSHQWTELAKAFNDGDIQWHKQEWKELFNTIRVEAKQEERARIKEMIFQWWHVSDKSLDEFLKELE